MSTLGAQRFSSSTLAIPLYGSAFADVVLENGAVPVAGPATLTTGGMSMTGAIIRADVDAPDLPHAVWANGVGWDTPLGPRAYASPTGVRLLTLLRDLAIDTGETFASLPADTTIGLTYARVGSTDLRRMTGRMVLASLRRAGFIGPWWIDGAGLTHLDARPTGAATGRNDIMRRNAAVGLRVFGLDDPSGFLPGTMLEGVTTRRLVVRESGGALSAEAWG